ncbi:hypothetical protein I4U23_020088 [Adineta vaga]|nr:hypothetical protein I4U23_020088 [Adineta vaga]
MYATYYATKQPHSSSKDPFDTSYDATTPLISIRDHSTRNANQDENGDADCGLFCTECMNCCGSNIEVCCCCCILAQCFSNL